jgi:hypothetical protein
MSDHLHAPAALYPAKVLLLSIGHTEQGRPSGNASDIFGRYEVRIRARTRTSLKFVVIIFILYR